jgi:putative membrane protein
VHLTAPILGVALAAALWTLPLADWIGGFQAHMARHALLVAVVPPLLVPLLPARGAPPVLPAAAAEFVVAWGWHLPAAHMAAWMSPLWRVVEQGSFLLAGLAVWWGAAAARPLAGAGGLLLTSIHMTMLGAVITLAPRVLYPYCDLEAQQTGAILMLAIATPAYLIGGLTLARRALDESPAA